MQHLALFSLITALLAADNRQRELEGIEYQLIRFNLDGFASDRQLEFDLSGTHYKVQLVPDDSTQISDSQEPHFTNADPSISCHYFGSVLEPKAMADSSYLSLSLCPNRGIRGSITTSNHDEIWIMPSAYYFDSQYGKRGIQLTEEHLVYTSIDRSTDHHIIDMPSSSSRNLLRSSWNNQVELFVMSDPPHTLRFKDTYGSNWYTELKAYVKDLINGASAKYKAKNWGNAGKIELQWVYLEIAESYSGDYASMYPRFSYEGIKVPGTNRYNCKDWKNYKGYQEGGCVITGSRHDDAMIHKFKSFVKRTNKHYDMHLLLVGQKMAGIAGVAFTFSMCAADGNVAIVGSKQKSLEAETKTVCHEIGHTFGMRHDVSCKQCIMGKWISWYDWGFEQQAYTQLNEQFTKDKRNFDCLRNGVRGFKDNYGSSGSYSSGGSSNNYGGSSGGSSTTDISKCVRVSNVRGTGEWKANGQSNGRVSYKNNGGYWLYTALDNWSNKVWTIDTSKYNGLNSKYYCYQTYIEKCSGKWVANGAKKTNSKFEACAAFEAVTMPSCVANNEYDDSLCLSNDGSLWDDEVIKRFDVKLDECLNDKPIYQHFTDENTSYHVYYDEYHRYVNDSDVGTRWVMSLDDYPKSVAAQCEEDDLLECMEGKWQVLTYFNDSVEMIVDETMAFSSGCTSSAAQRASDSRTIMVFVLIAAALMIILGVIVFVYRSRKLKGKKAVEFTQKSVIEDQSEDDIDGEEEEDVEIEVEQTKLTQTVGE